MRLLGAGCLVVALLLTPGASGGGGALPSPPRPPASRADDWPDGLPPVNVLSSWMSFRGAYTEDSRRVSYELYVDPAHLLLYRLTRYSVSAAAGATGEDALALETVQFIARPGREPPTCYQRRVAAGSPRPWIPLERGSARYRDEMFRGIEIFTRHRRTMP